MSGRRRNLAAIAIGASLAISAVAFLSASYARASPARYVLEKCDSALPGGGTTGAVFTGPAPYTPGNNCAEAGGALIILQGGPTASSSSYWTLPLPAPPGGYVESVRVTAEICNGTNHDPGTVAFAVQAGWPFSCAPEARTFGIASAAGSAGMLYLGCPGSCEQDPFVWAHYFAATEVDPQPPRIESLSGTLLEGGVARAGQSLLASAADEGGGLASMTLRVNGTTVEPQRLFPCQTATANNSSIVGTVAITPSPCPGQAESSWGLDTEEAPFREGLNNVEVCAQDFSTIGPPNEGCAQRKVRIDNSCPSSAVPGGESLRAVFKVNRRQRIRVRHGASALLAGKLTGQSGYPLAGAQICISARTLDSRTPRQLIGILTTDAAGHYAYRLSPGPSRAITVAYRQGTRQVEQSLRFLARAGARLRATPERLQNGQWVHFRGRIAGPARAGRVVVLQANVAGSKRWITFRKATTGDRGRFKAAYHFTSTTRKTKYRFRALVPRQAGYPWDQGASKRVSVTVTR